MAGVPADAAPAPTHAKPADQVTYLQSLGAVREQCARVYDATAACDPRACFRLHEDRLEGVADLVVQLAQRDYADPVRDIPPHSRWRHFLPRGCIEAALVAPMEAAGCAPAEIAAALVDLFVVSVLLDAGAGAAWTYRRGALVAGRSEGLAMASMDMFLRGVFADAPAAQPWRVDARALQALSLEALRDGLQADATNPVVGLQGRLELLQALGRVLVRPGSQRFFPGARPGGLVAHLAAQATGGSVSIERVWEVVVEGFGGVWPASRTRLHGQSLGDVWPCRLLDGALVPFHKLSQWLAYSLLEPLEAVAGLHITGKDRMTGLAEYRNGGLFVDAGVLQLKDEFRQDGQPSGPGSSSISFPAHHEVIVQWRALTVVLLDRVAGLVQRRLGLSPQQLPLPKVLEAGTWKAGRELAKAMRPDAAPPINILSDGTLF